MPRKHAHGILIKREEVYLMKRTASPITRIPDNTSLSQLKRQDLKRSKILTLQQCHPIGTNTLGLS
jgi:hypothetical protein